MKEYLLVNDFSSSEVANIQPDFSVSLGLVCNLEVVPHDVPVGVGIDP